jgi:phage terminase large subunit
MLQINKNFVHLVKTYEDGHHTGALLEGSSRSGKTFSSIDFIIWLCCNRLNDSTINIVRQTYNSFKTTLYDDFHKRLKDFGLKSPFDTSWNVAQFNIGTNTINFIGADTPTKFEGAGADFWYFNELLDISKIIFDLAEQRCRVFWWGDFNPKATKHWVFDNIMNRNNVSYCHSTFNDNPFISKIELNKIKSYEPTHYNIEQGTADEYMWNVYGLGIRAVNELTIFKKWQIYNTIIDSYDLKIYGLDFGYVNDPCAIVELIINCKNLYVKELCYKTNMLNGEIAQFCKALDKDSYIVADSAEPKSIADIRAYDIPIIPCVKGHDSILNGINKILEFNLFVHTNSLNLQNELKNYQRMKDRNGEVLSTPVDCNNHCIDAIRYALTKFRL